MPQSIGIFGGTFDPVHNGHLRIAEAARDQLELGTVLFIPNAQSPLKTARPSASFHDRMAMLRLAIEGHDRYVVSDVEGRRGGTSFTIDTLRELAKTYVDAGFVLILGSDSLLDIHHWRESAQIVKIARLAYVERPGSDVAEVGTDAVRIDVTPMEVSSTVVRERIRAGLAIADLVPHAVSDYIASHRLYDPPSRLQP